ncbi:hypothetical protein P7H17_21635 [Paenibacillus larvae]|nr:hypothetical protein [Paenibacillus larvae]
MYECVWEESYLGLDNTLMVHLRRLREKLRMILPIRSI